MIHVQYEEESQDAFHPLSFLALDAEHMDEVLH